MRHLVCAIMVAAALMCAGVNGLTVQVEPRTEECYIFECTKGDYVNVNVQVVRGGLLDINVKVNIVHSIHNKIKIKKSTIISSSTSFYHIFLILS